jgi:hypothetical protein
MTKGKKWSGGKPKAKKTEEASSNANTPTKVRPSP